MARTPHEVVECLTLNFRQKAWILQALLGFAGSEKHTCRRVEIRARSASLGRSNFSSPFGPAWEVEMGRPSTIGIVGALEIGQSSLLRRRWGIRILGLAKARESGRSVSLQRLNSPFDVGRHRWGARIGPSNRRWNNMDTIAARGRSLPLGVRIDCSSLNVNRRFLRNVRSFIALGMAARRMLPDVRLSSASLLLHSTLRCAANARLHTNFAYTNVCSVCFGSQSVLLIPISHPIYIIHIHNIHIYIYIY